MDCPEHHPLQSQISANLDNPLVRIRIKIRSIVLRPPFVVNDCNSEIKRLIINAIFTKIKPNQIGRLYLQISRNFKYLIFFKKYILALRGELGEKLNNYFPFQSYQEQ
jgi:hypothetical protein